MIRFFLPLIFIGNCIPGLSQDFKKYYAIVFDANMPLSNKDFVDNISKRGARFIYREHINSKFSVGGDLGFATYNDRLPPQTYTNGNTTVFAELFNYVYNYTLSLSGEYYFTEEKWIKPFAGLGIGMCYSRYTFYYNVFADQDRAWGGLVRPNVGTLLRFGKRSRLAARISIHFDYSTTKSADFDYNNFTNLGADAGLTLLFRP